MEDPKDDVEMSLVHFLNQKTYRYSNSLIFVMAHVFEIYSVPKCILWYSLAKSNDEKILQPLKHWKIAVTSGI